MLQLHQRIKIRFQKDASIRIDYIKDAESNPNRSIVQSKSHRACFEWLESSVVEAFLFEIDKTKAPAAAKKILDRIQSLGFSIEPAPLQGVIGNQQKYAAR